MPSGKQGELRRKRMDEVGTGMLGLVTTGQVVRLKCVGKRAGTIDGEEGSGQRTRGPVPGSTTFPRVPKAQTLTAHLTGTLYLGHGITSLQKKRKNVSE
uniref:Uncharacterized protein n=1 Tax=Steinernema glaseri TaxID=37863 RepID=A0A1I7ZBK3_9BILA